MSFKKTALALATLAAVSGAYADIQGQFVFGATGFYALPNDQHTEYFTDPVRVTQYFPQIGEKSIKQKWNMGFGLQAGYIFPDKNDVMVAWNYLGRTSANANAGTIYRNFGDLTNSINNDEVFSGNGNLHYIYNSVDVEVGHAFDTQVKNFCLHNRVFAGLRGAWLQRNIESYSNYTEHYTQTNLIPETIDTYSVFNENDESKFWGVGPRIGFGSDLDLGKGFGVNAQLAGFVLAGKLSDDVTVDQSSTVNYNIDNFFVGTDNHSSHANVNFGSKTKLIPGFDAKLGANYTYALSDNHKMRVELGYQITEYNDALYRTNVVAGSGDAVTGKHYGNWGYSGPYLQAVFTL